MQKVMMRVAVLVCVAASLAVAGCGASPGTPTPAVNAGTPFVVPKSNTITSAREVHQFESLRDMFHVSRLVVVGTVTKAQPGRIVAPGQEDAFQMRALTVRVETVLKGDTPSPLIVEEEGYIQGKPYSLNGSKWANPGARAVFFLMPNGQSVGDIYVLANSHSRYFLNGGRVTSNSGEVLADFEADLETMSPEQLLDAIRALR